MSPPSFVKRLRPISNWFAGPLGGFHHKDLFILPPACTRASRVDALQCLRIQMRTFHQSSFHGLWDGYLVVCQSIRGLQLTFTKFLVWWSSNICKVWLEVAEVTVPSQERPAIWHGWQHFGMRMETFMRTGTLKWPEWMTWPRYSLLLGSNSRWLRLNVTLALWNSIRAFRIWSICLFGARQNISIPFT